MGVKEQTIPRLPLVPGAVVEAMHDPEIEAYFRNSYVQQTPPPTSLSLQIHQPEVMRAWCRFVWGVFNRGVVEHRLKELVRVYMADAADCEY